MKKSNTIKSKWIINSMTSLFLIHLNIGSDDSKVIFCEADDWKTFYETNQSYITDLEIEMDRRNSAIPLKRLN